MLHAAITTLLLPEDVTQPDGRTSSNIPSATTPPSSHTAILKEQLDFTPSIPDGQTDAHAAMMYLNT